ncbi:MULTISPECIES: hypothetical protein [Lactobacillus]|uniref:hypothetical protein n=1 Tax=Lactobacillus TaxID=1578 RepID=UPI001FB42EFE|nr:MULTISPECIES: hypothetical protein [Lactobacillus]UOC05456.1 hypothetical protein LC811_06380 [Lactobacillus johnsonii]
MDYEGFYATYNADELIKVQGKLYGRFEPDTIVEYKNYDPVKYCITSDLFTDWQAIQNGETFADFDGVENFQKNK